MAADAAREEEDKKKHIKSDKKTTFAAQMQGSLFYAMKKNITLLLLLLSVATSFAQSIDDACLYSQTYYQGTAKGLGMGNALGAVGGDMTSISINPAGMGIYRNPEFALTVGLVDNIHKSTYYGETNSANQWRMSLPNLGYVYAKERSNYRPLRFSQFGITFNRTNDYNMHTYAHGLNSNSSRINNVFLDQIEGIEPEKLPFETYGAWQTYLIDDHLDDIGYYYTGNVPSKVWQSRTSECKGRSEEWNLSGSLNFYDKLFLGASLNINHIKRVGTTTYEENRPQDVESAFQKWDVAEETASTGWGFNGKLGIIYHANHWLRIGAAFHSPAYYSFDESKQLITESQFITHGFNSNTQQDNYKYNFFSPLKWVGSFAFVIGQSGIISLDAEYTNYGAARFNHSGDDYDYNSHNEAIKSTFGRTFNIRLGSEWRLSNSYLRFGAGYYGSPFGFGQLGGSVKKASIGISLPASDHFIFDFGYELSLGKQFIWLYDYDDLQSVEQNQFKNLVMVTVRFK